MMFQEKCFSCYILLTDQILLPFRLEILGNICIAIIYFPGCEVINFEINFIFLLRSFFFFFFFARLKNQDKNLYILKTKIAFKVK